MSARRRDLRLVPLALAAWAAGGVAIAVPGTAGWLGPTLWATALALLVVAWRWTAARGLALAAVAAALAAAVVTHVALAEPARGAAQELDVGGGRNVTIEAVVVGKVEPSLMGWSFDAIAGEASWGSQRAALDVPIRVRTSSRPPGLDLGARVSIRGTIKPADTGRRAALEVRATTTVTAPPSGVFAAAAALRTGLLAQTKGLPQPGAGLIAGLAVGDTSGVDAELDAAMKASSLSHLTAVSGANCALVVGLAFAAAAMCGARRGIRVSVAISALAAFVLLVSPEPSVVRAAAMAAIAMGGVLLGRVGTGISVLSLAVIVCLVADPWLALSLGFALSAVATGALLVGAGPLAVGLARAMPYPLALAIAVPLSAQLACGPLLILIAPTVPLYGVLANLLAGPAAPFATVLGLAACLCAGIPGLGAGLTALAWAPAAWIAQVASTTSQWPAHALGWWEGLPGLIALALVGASVAALTIGRRYRRTALVVVAVTVGVVVGSGPISDVVRQAQVPATWAIAACNVGQGDAALVRSEGKIALIDTGPEPAALTRCLDLMGVDRIDLLVLTHFDLDHRGGVPAVIGRVDTVIHGPVSDAEQEGIVRSLTEHGARAVQGRAGMTGMLGGASWNVLWPSVTAPVEGGNAASVVIEIAGGGIPSALFLGDLNAESQQMMAASPLFHPSYQVIKVAHHGSADQFAGLYERALPAVGLVSVGKNTYGHPRKEILAILAAVGAVTGRTDREGTLVVSPEGAGLSLWREG